MIDRQTSFTFPPPLSAKQLAAARELDRIVTAARNSFSVQDYARRRTAQLKATRKGQG